jgi:zinc protease
MGYLVIGDAATQFEKFKNAGFDEVLLLDKDAKKVESSDIKM